MHTRRRPIAIQQVLLQRPRPADIPLLRQEAVLPAGHVAGAAREAVGVRAPGFAMLGETPSTELSQIKSYTTYVTVVDTG